MKVNPGKHNTGWQALVQPQFSPAACKGRISRLVGGGPLSFHVGAEELTIWDNLQVTYPGYPQMTHSSLPSSFPLALCPSAPSLLFPFLC